jgi:SAM-dependent methyltransferase
MILSSARARLDAGLLAALGLGRHLPPIEPLALRLASHRRGVARTLLERYLPLVEPLREAVLARDPEAVKRFDSLLQGAVDAMRASRPAGALAALGAVDRALYRDDPEYLDDPAFPRDQRVEVLAALDRLNRGMKSYERWTELVLELVRRAEDSGRSTARVHDLASGHGGFALSLKESLGDSVDVIASDLVEEYLDLGRAEARSRRVDVRFVKQDATDLHALADRSIDIFTCTQTVHHFPPGMVGRIVAQAASVARTGVLLIDAERGVVPIALLAPAMALLSRSWPAVHDTVVSLRRMYFEEELGLIIELSPLPAGARVDTGRFGPGYAYARVLVGKTR